MPPPLNLPLPLALNVNQSGYDSYSTASHAESESGFRPELSHFEALFFGMETQSSRDQEERRGLKGNEAWKVTRQSKEFVEEGAKACDREDYIPAGHDTKNKLYFADKSDLVILPRPLLVAPLSLFWRQQVSASLPKSDRIELVEICNIAIIPSPPLPPFHAAFGGQGDINVHRRTPIFRHYGFVSLSTTTATAATTSCDLSAIIKTAPSRKPPCASTWGLSEIHCWEDGKWRKNGRFWRERSSTDSST